MLRIMSLSRETVLGRLAPENRLTGAAMTVEVRLAPEDTGSACARIFRHARILSGQLRSLSTTLFPPAATKTLRSFSSGEVAKVVGVSDGYLRQLSLDGLGPILEVAPNGRRSYTLQQINELRLYLASARPREASDFWQRRR